MNDFTLTVMGKATGKGRPRFVRKTGRTFTPQETMTAENEVRRLWEEAGSPRLEGPVRLLIRVVAERPKGHFRKGGGLNTAGERCPIPTVKPDLDNALKLVMDALNTRAWKDDVQVAEVGMRREWGDRACTVIRASEATAG